MSKDISIIILTYNSEKHIKKCLFSFSNSQLVKEVIVVDNFSTDNTSKIVKKIKKVCFIRNSKNFGFSKGINIGIKEARGSKILILNPDTFASPKAIENLVRCMTNNQAGIVGGRLIKISGKVHNTYVKEPDIFTGLFDYTNLRKTIPGDIFHRHHYYLNKKINHQPTEVDAVSGAYMLVRKKVFNKTGLFDENFFMYLEDIDFCIRAKRLGFKIYYCPLSTITHIGGASSHNRDKINYEAWSNSRKYYFLKHKSPLENLLIQPIFIIDDLVSTIWRRIR